MKKIHIRRLFISFLIILSIPLPFLFNSCAETSFGQRDLDSILKSTRSLLINDGDTYTKDKRVILTIEGDFSTRMYITNDPQCSKGGKWENYSKGESIKKSWTLSQENQEVSVYIKFQTEEQESDCYSDSIIHDKTPPQITFKEISHLWIAGEKFKVNFFISDDRELKETSCSLSESFIKFSDCRDSYILVFNASERTKTLYVKAFDKAGNKKTSSFTVQQDKTPSLIVLRKSPPSLTNIQRGKFIFDVVDGESGVKEIKCRLKGQEWEDCSSKTYQTHILSEGSHIFEIKALNQVGLSSEASYTWTIDTTAPDCQLAQIPSSPTKETQILFTLPSSKDVNYECRHGYKKRASSFQSCSKSQSYSNLGHGNHTFELKCTDSSGNSSNSSYSWFVDIKSPSMTFSQKPKKFTKETTATFRFSVTDDSTPFQKIECRLDQRSFEDCSLSEASFDSLRDGEHEFKIRAIDAVGLKAEIFYTWTVDTTAPQITFRNKPEPLGKLQTAHFSWSLSESGGVKTYCSLNLHLTFSSVLSNTKKFQCNTLASHRFNEITEGEHTFYVLSVDKLENWSVSQYTWTVDITPPRISFSQKPEKIVYENHRVIVHWTVQDTSGVKSNTPSFVTKPHDDSVKDFSNIGDLYNGNLSFTPKEIGSYKLRIRAEDKAGNTTRVELDFQVTHDFVEKTKSFTIKENAPVDFLFIIDNSSSMKEEQIHLSDKINTFIQKLNADDIDWNIALQSTDVDNGKNNMKSLIWNRLNFREESSVERKYILKKQDSYFDSDGNLIEKQDILGQTILSFGIEGSWNERGIKSLIYFLENKDTYPQNDLLRPDAYFISILISDEDESSTHSYHIYDPSQVQKFINKKVATLGNSKVFQFHSIVNPSKGSCATTNVKGTVYEMLSNTDDPKKGILPGEILNICSSDYTTVLDEIADSVKDLTKEVLLECSSVDVNDNGDFKDDIEILPDPQVEFTLNQDKNKITFEIHLNPESYDINYSCARN